MVCLFVCLFVSVRLVREESFWLGRSRFIRKDYLVLSVVAITVLFVNVLTPSSK